MKFLEDTSQHANNIGITGEKELKTITHEKGRKLSVRSQNRNGKTQVMLILNWNNIRGINLFYNVAIQENIKRKIG